MKISFQSVLLTALLSILLSACASVPLAPPEMDLQVKNMAPPPDKALVYFYRDQVLAGGGVKIITAVDDQIIGETAMNTYLLGLFEPGKYKTTAKMADRGGWATLTLNAKAGETYYVEQKFVVGRQEAGLTLVSKRHGREAVNGCKLALPDEQAQTPIITVKAKTPDAAQVALFSAASDAASSKSVLSDVDAFPVGKKKADKNSYAIVIGIEKYRQKLPAADYATQDAKLVADYLTNALGYSEANVITLLNDRATNADLVKYFEKWLPNNVEQGATVFVYYSGHGAPSPNTGDAYLVPFDGDPSFIDETGYSLKRMYAALGKLPAKQIIVVLDSCFSGAGARSVIAKGSRPLVMNLQANASLPKNITVLSASSGEQISSTYDEKGHGLFTYFFLKGIKNEEVVRSDGSLDVSALYDYVKPQVERIARKQYNNEQTPQLIEPKKN